MCPLLSFSPHIFYVTYVIRKNKKNILNLSKANKHIKETSPFYMPEPKLYVALVYVRTWAAEERREQECCRPVDHPLPSRPPPRLAQLRDAERGSISSWHVFIVYSNIILLIIHLFYSFSVVHSNFFHAFRRKRWPWIPFVASRS